MKVFEDNIPGFFSI